jgi:acetyltransferase
VAQAVARLRDDGVEVPVYVCWVAPRTARENAATLQTAGVPVIEWPARTARAVAGARVAARAQERVRDDEPDDAARAPLPSPPTDVGDPLAVRRWLLQAGVDVAPVSLHRTAVGAVDVAQRWFDHGHSDVVVKVARAAHRSDSGGVRLGLRDANAVRAAAEALLSRGDRLLVMPQLTGAEVVVGSAHDPPSGRWSLRGWAASGSRPSPMSPSPWPPARGARRATCSPRCAGRRGCWAGGARRRSTWRPWPTWW